MKKVIAIITIVFTLVFTVSACSPDPNDGKCDICGKAATYRNGREEYCSKHSFDAAKWYIKQGLKDD